MKVIREIELNPNFFSFYLNSDFLHVESIQKDDEGKDRPIPDVQYLELDDYAKTLLGNLESWIKRNLK